MGPPAATAAALPLRAVARRSESAAAFAVHCFLGAQLRVNVRAGPAGLRVLQELLKPLLTPLAGIEMKGRIVLVDAQSTPVIRPF